MRKIVPSSASPTHPLADASTVGRLFISQARRVGRLLLRKLRNPEDAEDTAQDVFLKLWRYEREGSLKDDAEPYLRSAAHTAAIDALRRRASRHLEDSVETNDSELQAPIDQEDHLHWRKGVERLAGSLQELPKAVQQVFVLYHFEGLSHVEIAQRLGISTRSVERHMARALRECKERLGEYL